MKSYAIVFTTLASVILSSNAALAIAPYKKVFDAAYVKTSENAEFQAAFKKASCYTCHVKGKKKDYLNAYGLKLAEFVEGNAKDQIDEAKKKGKDQKKAKEEELAKAFGPVMKKVEAEKSPNGKTYAEMFKALTLPTPAGAKSIRTTPTVGAK